MPEPGRAPECLLNRFVQFVKQSAVFWRVAQCGQGGELNALGFILGELVGKRPFVKTSHIQPTVKSLPRLGKPHFLSKFNFALSILVDVSAKRGEAVCPGKRLAHLRKGLCRCQTGST